MTEHPQATATTNGPEVYEFGSEKTQAISKDLLSRSIRQEGKFGKMLDSKPIQVWAMIDLIAEILDKNNINYSADQIHVQRRSSGTYLNDLDRERGYTKTLAPIEKWKFDKAINLIQLPGISSDANNVARNATIGVTMNDHGLSVAFGMNVHECTNFNVYGGTILRSYTYNSQQGMPWELMKIKLNEWVAKMDQIWNLQNSMVKEMKEHEVEVNISVIDEIIGDLYIRALKSAYFKGGVTPFNTYELSEFTQRMIKEQKDTEVIGNVWDLYNWGTSIMKPGTMDIGEISNNSNLWADYLVGSFSLEVEDAQILEN